GPGTDAELQDLLADQAFDLSGGYRRRRASLPAALLGLATEVIAVAPAAFGRLTADHGAATASAAQPSFEQRAVAQPRALSGTFDPQQCLHLLPDRSVYDRLVLARVDLLPVTDLTDVGDVGQELTQAVPREGLAPA